MNETLVVRPILVRTRWLLVALFVVLHVGCSSGNESFLEYDSESTLNPAGPAAPSGSAPVDPLDPDNLIFNGGAELGYEGWRYQGAPITVSSEEARTGSNSIYIENREESWHAPVVDLPRDLISGVGYQMSVWVKLAAGVDPTTAIMTINREGDFIRVGTAAATDDDWVQITGLYTHEEMGNGDFFVFIEAESASANYYVDDLEMRDTEALVVNGGVEAGVEPWRYQGGEGVYLAQANEVARSGMYSLFVGGRTEGWHGAVMDLPLSLPTDVTYDMSVWVYLAPGTEDSLMKLTLKQKVDGEDTFFEIVEAEATAEEWVHLAGTYEHHVEPEPMGEGELTELYVYIESTNPVATYYVDDLDVRPAMGE